MNKKFVKFFFFHFLKIQFQFRSPFPKSQLMWTELKFVFGDFFGLNCKDSYLTVSIAISFFFCLLLAICVAKLLQRDFGGRVWTKKSKKMNVCGDIHPQTPLHSVWHFLFGTSIKAYIQVFVCEEDAYATDSGTKGTSRILLWKNWRKYIFLPFENATYFY